VPSRPEHASLRDTFSIGAAVMDELAAMDADSIAALAVARVEETAPYVLDQQHRDVARAAAIETYNAIFGAVAMAITVA
jgi:hypothetical protein